MTNNRILLRSRLHYFEATAARYKDTSNPDERLALRLLKQERNRIEKQLYPSAWLRLVRTLVVVIRQQDVRKQETKKANGNEHELKEVLQKMGFVNIDHKLPQLLKQGQPDFSISVSHYQNGKERIEYDLFFTKNQKGDFQFEAYKAVFRGENKLGETRQRTFQVEQGAGFSAKEAANLLAGRAVQKEHFTLERERQNRWMQLDLNDKDAAGKFRVKEYQTSFDLKQLIAQLPLKDLSTEAKEELVNHLLIGGRQPVIFLKEGKEQSLFLEANPQHQTINVYDEQGKKISLATALRNRTPDDLRVIKNTHQLQEKKHNRKNGLSLG